jgi:hypothetical protein
MSLIGMNIFLCDPQELNKLQKITLELAEGVKVEVSIKFPWVKRSPMSFQHGVSFVSISNQDKNKLFDFINTYGKKIG